MKFSSCALLSLLSLLAAAAPSDITRRAGQKFDYGSKKVRGVNLGGWFVLEPWITPKLFQDSGNANIVDEYTYWKFLGKTEANKRLQHHWRSWITQGDFNQIANLKLNHVRIPVGYWSVTPLKGEPFGNGAYKVLGESLDWAQQAGLKVMIDLHGAPKSQNGFDNSGRRGPIGWTQGDTVKQTLNALQKLRKDFASHPAVASIELLNEPFGPSLNLGTIKQFYRDGYGKVANGGASVVFQDAFQNITDWNSFGNDLKGLVLDTHHYEVFETPLLKQSPQDHIKNVCNYGKLMASVNKPTICGEWTGALTDCAKWLNGRGRGSRYEGTYENNQKIGSCKGKDVGTVAGLGRDDKSNTRRIIEAQLDAYEKAGGWIFWTWKTQGAPEWDMQALVQGGVFPNPLTQRKHPNQCG